MSSLSTKNEAVYWKGYEKKLLLISFVFFLILSVPLWDYHFYVQLFSGKYNVYKLFEFTSFIPQFISQSYLPQFGIASFANIIIALLLAIAGGLLWSYYDRKKERDYDALYYWLRVLVRYRLAFALIGFGFIKLFPLQMPYPSLSNLHTNFGDFNAWKIYYHSFGISPKYESFMGFVELLAGLFLLQRRTATLGAGIILGFTGNVAIANFAYEIGDHVYAVFLLLLAVPIFIYDIPRLYTLLVKQKRTIPSSFIPPFTPSVKKARYVLKTAFLLFGILFGAVAYHNYATGPYLLPRNKGIEGSYGFYNVKHFVLNHDTIPYTLTNPLRWQNVIFEKWSTISIKTARPVKIDRTKGDSWQDEDINRSYELAGTIGRHYYDYDADTVNHALVLNNKNKNHQGESLYLSYQFINDTTIFLTGVNEKSDSITAVLEKINKKYMLFEGRRKPVKL